MDHLSSVNTENSNVQDQDSLNLEFNRIPQQTSQGEQNSFFLPFYNEAGVYIFLFEGGGAKI